MALIFVLLFGLGCVIQAAEEHKFSESITLTPLNFYLKQKFPKTKECYEEQKDVYEKFITQFTREMTEISEKIGRDLEDYPVIKQKFKRNCEGITKLMKAYPQKLWLNLKKKKYEKASEVLERNKNKVMLYEIAIKETMLKLKAKSKKVSESVDEKFLEVQNRAIKTSDAIYTDLFYCVSAL